MGRPLLEKKPHQNYVNKPRMKELKKLSRNLFPVLRWGRNYTFGLLVNDLLAGTTLASVALPQAMAYARIK